MRDPARNESEHSEAAVSKTRPWGPASYWRSGLVVMAIVIAVVLVLNWLAPLMAR